MTNVYQSREPISLDRVAQLAPSVIAEKPHDTRSDRYAYVPTMAVLKGLEGEGYGVYGVTEAAVRDHQRNGYQKHLIRLRRESDFDRHEAMELVLINSHDGSSSYHLMAGLFRFACANGMICGESFQDVKVRHTGDVVGDVIEGTYEVVQSFPKVQEQVAAFKATTLNEDEQAAFAESALALRYTEKEAPISTEQALWTRRSADSGRDLWTVSNRLQETLVRGGQRFWTRDADGRPRRGSVRPVKGIDQNRTLNRALWTLTERMAELKAA